MRENIMVFRKALFERSMQRYKQAELYVQEWEASGLSSNTWNTITSVVTKSRTDSTAQHSTVKGLRTINIPLIRDCKL